MRLSADALRFALTSLPRSSFRCPYALKGTDRLDPSGLVKGWAVDRAAAILDEARVEEFAISAGGDMRLRGTWRIGIQHPHDPHKIAAALEMTDLAIATSGEYARGRHMYAPHTGQSPTGVLSVTIAGPEGWRLPDTFLDPQSSKLRAEVVAGRENVLDFQLEDR